MSFTPQERRGIRTRLLRWYDRYKRDLPWRRRAGDGYAQLLAEFMLQQTQVSTVVPYYERFMARFPTVQALAQASLDDVLALWSGLGYYSRARNLHAAAQRIVSEHGGAVPRRVDELIALPGIGRYTAGAIASVAFDTVAPVLDGNVARVLMRWLALERDPKHPHTQAELWSTAEALLPVKRCGDFNQALMELGATVCSPKSPNCLLCPVRIHCRAHELGLTDRVPPPKRRATVREAAFVVALVRKGDQFLLVQRREKGLWAGLWEPPSEPILNGEAVGTAFVRLRSALGRGLRWSDQPMVQVTRQLTHRRITFHAQTARVSPRWTAIVFDGRPWRWVAQKNFGGLGMSRACEAVFDQTTPLD